MQCYYMQGDKRVGPRTPDEVCELVKRGVIASDTLVSDE